MKNLTVALAFLMTLSLPVSAQDFQKGLAAAQAGDYATALKEWTPLAISGDRNAQFNLALMYYIGRGGPTDYAKAVGWSRLAAERGHVSAQSFLASMYKDGKGVLQDYVEAVKWWRLAAEQGDADAQTNLGWMYNDGKGVLQDNATAHMWYNIAAANGAGGTNRDNLAKSMTSAAIEKARAMARECMNSDYQNCGE